MKNEKVQQQQHQAMPQHVSSPVKPQAPALTTPPPTNLLPDYPNVEIVNSSPAAIRVGFFDARVEATNSSELPGSSTQHGEGGREGVITTPPSTNKKPAAFTQERRSTSPRATSIEEADRGRGTAYAPMIDALLFTQRKASATPSQFSVLSVSVLKFYEGNFKISFSPPPPLSHTHTLSLSESRQCCWGVCCRAN